MARFLVVHWLTKLMDLDVGSPATNLLLEVLPIAACYPFAPTTKPLQLPLPQLLTVQPPMTEVTPATSQHANSKSPCPHPYHSSLPRTALPASSSLTRSCRPLHHRSRPPVPHPPHVSNNAHPVPCDLHPDFQPRLPTPAAHVATPPPSLPGRPIDESSHLIQYLLTNFQLLSQT